MLSVDILQLCHLLVRTDARTLNLYSKKSQNQPIYFISQSAKAHHLVRLSMGFISEPGSSQCFLIIASWGVFPLPLPTLACSLGILTWISV